MFTSEAVFTEQSFTVKTDPQLEYKVIHSVKKTTLQKVNIFKVYANSSRKWRHTRRGSASSVSSVAVAGSLRTLEIQKTMAIVTLKMQ